ncbi:hypothetical protein ID866_5208 [Astraeus odoratus]|nr:hypothetical protein ID866_5208 [Astraeus odoratus]
MSTGGSRHSELRNTNANSDHERDILSPLSSPPDEGHLHRAGLLQPRTYSRTNSQPRLSGDIRDSTVQLSNLPFPSSHPFFLQEPPTTSGRNPPSSYSFISPTDLDSDANVDPHFHLSASPSTKADIPPLAASSDSQGPSTSVLHSSQVPDASQKAIHVPVPMTNRGGDSTPFTPSALSLLLARGHPPSKDVDADAFGLPCSNPPFSTGLPPPDECSQSSSKTLQGDRGSSPIQPADVDGSSTRGQAGGGKYSQTETSCMVDEITPLLGPVRSSRHGNAVTSGDSGSAPSKKSTVESFRFPKRFRHWWERFDSLRPENLARTAVSSIPSVILGTLLNILDGLSYGMIIFPASGVFASLGGMGVSIFFVSTLVAQLVFTCGGSNFAGANGSMMIEVVPFFHIIASTIAAEIGEENVREVIATTLVAFALSSLLTGLTFFLLGYLRLGVLIGFFPRHILVGCIGGVGVFLILTGLTVSTRLPSDALDPPTLDTLRYFASDVHALAQWVPPLALAILLRVVTSRWKHQLLFPVYFLIIPTVFYVIVAAAGLDLHVLRKDGWLFESAQGTAGLEDKWYGFYSYYDPALVRWSSIWYTLPTQFALLFFNVLHPPLNVPALSVSLDQDIDTNKELVGHGFSNLLSGLLGSVPNYLVYVNTLLFYRLGGGTRVAGFMLAVATFFLLILGTAPVAYIPVVVVSALIFVLGIDLVKEALWDTRHRVSRMEYITIISIMVTMTVWDFVIGVLLGIIVSSFFFVIQNSQRRSIRACYTGDAAMSTVRRPAAHRAYIREVSKQTRILQLQGFLFFGTIVHVEDTLRSLVEDPNWRRNPVRFVIVDLTLVAGVDMSSAEAFVRVQRLLAAKGVVLVFCGVSAESAVGKALACCGILEEPQVELCETLHDALEWTENAYLRAWFRVQKTGGTPVALPGRQRLALGFQDMPTGSPRDMHLRAAGDQTIAGGRRCLHLWSQVYRLHCLTELLSHSMASEPLSTLLKAFQPHDEIDRDALTHLVPYFERASVPEGHVLWEMGDEPDGLYIIQSGILRASYKFAEHTPVVEESMVSGTLAGELSALSGLPRNATVIVERPAVLWKLSRASMRQLEQDHPHLAQTFVRLVLKGKRSSLTYWTLRRSYHAYQKLVLVSVSDSRYDYRIYAELLNGRRKSVIPGAIESARVPDKAIDGVDEAPPILYSTHASPPLLGITKMPVIPVSDPMQANVLYNNRIEKRDNTVFVQKDRSGYYCVYLVTSSTNKVAVDTGSAYTWVGALEHNPYVQGSASSATGVTVKTTYASQLTSFKGQTYNDTIGLGALIIKRQGMGVPTEVNGFPAGIDGILGLGPTRLTIGISSDGKLIPTVVDNLYSQGSISSPFLGVYFTPGTAGSSGLLSFGQIHSTVLTSVVKYMPVTTNSPAKYFWGVDAAISYGDDTEILHFGSGNLDTGAPRITIASAAFGVYVLATGAILHPSGVPYISQNQYNNLQTLYIVIGGESYPLSPNAQIHPRSSLNSAIFLTVQRQPADSRMAFSLGIPFFQRYYVAFNSTSNEIGFASHIYTDSTTN